MSLKLLVSTAEITSFVEITNCFKVGRSNCPTLACNCSKLPCKVERKPSKVCDCRAMRP